MKNKKIYLLSQLFLLIIITTSCNYMSEYNNNLIELLARGVFDSDQIKNFSDDIGILLSSDSYHWFYYDLDKYIDAGPYLKKTTIDDNRIVFEIYGNSTSKLKVCSWNIGKFSYGNAQSLENDEILYSKIENWQKAFDDINSDLICLNEYSGYADYKHNILTYDCFFKDRYLYFDDFYNGRHKDWSSIAFGCNYKVIKKESYVSKAGLENVSYNRCYIHFIFQIDGKNVDVWCIHYIPNGTAKKYSLSPEKVRFEESKEIISKIEESEYSIILGDFNALPSSPELTVFKDNHFRLSNGGFLGEMDTRYLQNTPIDNIIVSHNIIINSVNVIDTYNSVTSDHMPIVSEILLI